MLLIFLGAPGSGKGTISSKMVEKYGYKHISTGEIFRQIILDKTELGLKVKELINNGNLVDDKITWEIVKNSFKTIDLNNDKIILDGYPRNINQAKLMESWFKIILFTDFKFIYFEVNEDLIIQRLTGRIICKKCGKIYHKFFSPPKKKWLCDYDNSSLYQREDDKIENIKVRLSIYNKLTKPLIKYYKNKDELFVINGNKETDDVVNKIIKKINL